jgi:hypothetical protein
LAPTSDGQADLTASDDTVELACIACQVGQHDECSDPARVWGPRPSSEDGLPMVAECCCGQLARFLG